MPLLSGSQRSLSLYHLLHPADTSGRPRPSLSHGQSRPKDIVSKGVISDEIAHTLFFFFHNTLNPIILLLDPALHTYDYIRTRSTFLFTSILAAAARFIAPVFSSALAKELGDHSVQAILGSKRCTETVQAWMMLYFWKDPRDTRAWTYVGLLCRAAVEIGLDRTPLSVPPTSSETEHREHRNRIRTWMLAFMMDRALASVTGKDWCIRGTDAIIQDCRRFSNHPLRLHGDAVIAGFAELRLISSKATDSLPKRTKITNQEQQNVIARILLNANFDLDNWHSFWEAETAAKQSPPVFMEFLRFFELHIRLNLNSFAVNLARVADEIPVDVPLNPTMARAETYCYNLAINSLNQLRVLSTIDQRILQYAQDSMSIMIAYAACFLRALVNSPTLSLDDRSKAIQTINETSQLFRRDDDADGTESSAQMQAKFLRSLAERQAGPTELPMNSPLDTQAIDLSDPRMMELMSWFSNPTQIQEPPAPEIPFMPLGEPSSGLDTLPGLEDLGDQGWDELLSSWLDVPPTQDYTF